MKKDLSYYLSLRYKTSIEFEQSDNKYVAWHPELGRGSCNGIGVSPIEAISALEEDSKDFITLLFETGQSIPLPESTETELPSGQFVLRIPRTLHKKIKELSEKEKVSTNQYVVSILSEFVGGNSAFNKLAHKFNRNFRAQLISDFEKYQKPANF